MQYVPNIGEVPEENARRDAVHIALAPVVAGEKLYPGERVHLLNGQAYVNFRNGCQAKTPFIGVVDPFLMGEVEKGQRFWLMLLPNTITGLRHVWQHPAFSIKVPSQE